jgi:hypothetical protein
MKYSLIRIERYQAMLNLLTTATEMFSQYPADAAKLAEFEEKVQQATSIYAQLMTPADVYRKQVTEKREKLRDEVLKLSARAIAVAESIGNTMMLETLKRYVIQARKTNTFKLLQITDLVCQSLEQHQTTADSLGLTAAYLTRVRAIATEFSGHQDETVTLYSMRRVHRETMDTMLSDLHKLVYLHLDPAVKILSNKEGDFYIRWRNLLSRRKGKRTVKKGDEQLGAILGMVSDLITALPVAGAVVTVAAQQAVATTDADGTYLIEGLLPGAFVVACSASGYEVPATIQVSIAAQEELTVDFTLQAQASAVA